MSLYECSDMSTRFMMIIFGVVVLVGSSVTVVAHQRHVDELATINTDVHEKAPQKADNIPSWIISPYVTPSTCIGDFVVDDQVPEHISGNGSVTISGYIEDCWGNKITNASFQINADDGQIKYPGKRVKFTLKEDDFCWHPVHFSYPCTHWEGVDNKITVSVLVGAGFIDAYQLDYLAIDEVEYTRERERAVPLKSCETYELDAPAPINHEPDFFIGGDQIDGRELEEPNVTSGTTTLTVKEAGQSLSIPVTVDSWWLVSPDEDQDHSFLVATRDEGESIISSSDTEIQLEAGHCDREDSPTITWDIRQADANPDQSNPDPDDDLVENQNYYKTTALLHARDERAPNGRDTNPIAIKVHASVNQEGEKSRTIVQSHGDPNYDVIRQEYEDVRKTFGYSAGTDRDEPPEMPESSEFSMDSEVIPFTEDAPTFSGASSFSSEDFNWHIHKDTMFDGLTQACNWATDPQRNNPDTPGNSPIQTSDGNCFGATSNYRNPSDNASIADASGSSNHQYGFALDLIGSLNPNNPPWRYRRLQKDSRKRYIYDVRADRHALAITLVEEGNARRGQPVHIENGDGTYVSHDRNIVHAEWE